MDFVVGSVVRFLMDCWAHLLSCCYWTSSHKSAVPRPGRQVLPPITDPILLTSGCELSRKIKSRILRCEDVVRSFVERSRQLQPHLNAIVDERFDEAIVEAQSLDRDLDDNSLPPHLLSSPLLGLPFSGKDSISVTGLSLTAGLTCRRAKKSAEDAAVVSNLKNIGGSICTCVTNVPELCFWLDSENKLYGRTNNPYDLNRIPGGSTGGNGALISAAGSVIGNAADIGGSIRFPAAFNGIFGHKPSPGVTPLEGIYPAFTEHRKSFLTHGPLTRYACDLLPVLEAMVGGREALERKLPDIYEKTNVPDLKVYYMTDCGSKWTTAVEPVIRETLMSAVSHFQSLGCPVQQVNIRSFCQNFDTFVENYKDPESPALSMQLTDCRFDVSVWTELAKCLFGMSSEYTLPVLMVCAIEKISGVDIASAKTQKFRRLLSDLKTEFADIVKDDGIFLFPSFPTVAPRHGTTLFHLFDGPSYMSIFNVMGVPVTQVPMGLSPDDRRMPIGLQVVAGVNRDRLTIAAALELEEKFGGWIPPSDVLIPSSADSSSAT